MRLTRSRHRAEPGSPDRACSSHEHRVQPETGISWPQHWPDGTVHVVDLPPARHATTVLPTGSGATYAASFSSDDSMLATANTDGTVQDLLAAGHSPRHHVLPRFGAVDKRALQLHTGSRSSPSRAPTARSRIWDADGGDAREGDRGIGRTAVVSSRFSPRQRGISLPEDKTAPSIVTKRGEPVRRYCAATAETCSTSTSTAPAPPSSARGSTARSGRGSGRTSLRSRSCHDRHVRPRRHSDRVRRRRRATPHVAPRRPHPPPRHSRPTPATAMRCSPPTGHGSSASVTTGGQRPEISATEKRTGAFAPGAGPVETALPDPDDRRLVVGGQNGRIVIIDHDGVEIERLQESGSTVNTARFSPDGRSVVAARADGSVTLWAARPQADDDQASRLQSGVRRHLQPWTDR